MAARHHGGRTRPVQQQRNLTEVVAGSQATDLGRILTLLAAQQRQQNPAETGVNVRFGAVAVVAQFIRLRFRRTMCVVHLPRRAAAAPQRIPRQ